MFNHSNMFRPLNRSHHQGVQNPWELQAIVVICYNVVVCMYSRREVIVVECWAFCWFVLFFSITLPIRNPIRSGLASMLGLRGERPSINCLNIKTKLYIMFCWCVIITLKIAIIRYSLSDFKVNVLENDSMSEHCMSGHK